MTKITDVVFEGGGVKAVAFTGALTVMESRGYKWKNIAGTSAGSIAGALLSVGYLAEQIKYAMINLDYTKMKDSGKIDIPCITPAINMIFKKGLYKGNYIENWMENLLQDKMRHKTKGNRKVKFKDLIIPGEDGILLNDKKYKRKYKLHVIATDITRGKILILPEDIEDYGMNPDNLDVSLAVRMSISIPYFYEPVTIISRKDNRKYYIADGGLLSNYPVWIFDTKNNPIWPTLGFKLTDMEKEKKYNNITNLCNYSKSVVETCMQSAIDMDVFNMNNLRTIDIDTLGIKTTEFDLSKKDITRLYRSGQKASLEFLDHVDERYAMYINLRKRFAQMV